MDLKDFMLIKKRKTKANVCKECDILSGKRFNDGDCATMMKAQGNYCKKTPVLKIKYYQFRRF